MSVIEVHGPCRVKGEIKVQGSKNAVLPMMAASVLHRGITIIDNVPRIQDVFCMMGILDSLGCFCELSGHRLTIDAGSLSASSVSREEMERMRSSIMLLGALLARTGEAVVYYPGGCMIGKRPIDLHLTALEKLGAQVRKIDEEGCISAEAPSLKGAAIHFPFPSVGATENAVFAAVAAEGSSYLSGCAREPEIDELCHFLNNMGASIRGIGSGSLFITGKLPLHDSHFTVGGDRIVAGTYLMAAAGAGGEALVTGIESGQLREVSEDLRRMGAVVYEEEDLIYLKSEGRLKSLSVKTGPYPGFPTDLQSMMMVLMSLAGGGGTIEETIFENRFKTALELEKLGARIKTEDKKAYIYGPASLKGTWVEASDLRGGAALVSAGLSAEGITRIKNCGYIERGYEDICEDLKSLGAGIRYIGET